MDYIVDLLIDAYGPVPYIAIFVILLACGLGIPIPEDVTLIAGGILAYYGISDVWIMIAVGLLGVMIGDSFVYFLGRKFGPRLMNVWPFRLFLHPDKVEKFRIQLESHGGKLLFSARFMPGVRSTVFFSTGFLKIPYSKLLIYDGMAALLSVPAIVYSVFYFGDYLESVINWIKKVEGGILGVIVVAAIVIGYKIWKNKRT